MSAHNMFDNENYVRYQEVHIKFESKGCVLKIATGTLCINMKNTKL